jgi:hypothetical protein
LKECNLKKKPNTPKHLDILRQNSGYDRSRDWRPTNGHLGERREDDVDRATAYVDANKAFAAGARWTGAATPKTSAGKIQGAILPDWQPTSGPGPFREMGSNGAAFPGQRNVSKDFSTRWNDSGANARRISHGAQPAKKAPK